ncbi:hypothetical protein D3C71_1964430 [compost metagenome]
MPRQFLVQQLPRRTVQDGGAARHGLQEAKAHRVYPVGATLAPGVQHGLRVQRAENAAVTAHAASLGHRIAWG